MPEILDLNKPLIKIFFGLYETLGDVIVSTALLQTIKDKYPNSFITYCVSKQYSDVLYNNPNVNEIIPANSVGEVILRSVEKQYDKVYLPLQLTPEHNSWHQFPPYCLEEGKEHHNLVDYYADRCMDDLKITKRETFMYPEDKHWNEIVDNLPPEYKDHFVNTPFVTLHTTSRNISKDWPYDKWAELGKRIKEKYGTALEVYQMGAEADKALPKPIIPLTGIPLLLSAAILKRSLLHIDGDSGPAFIATSVGIKTLCIMGATTNTNGTSGPICNVEFIEPNRHCLDKLYTPCATQCRIAPQCIDSVSVDEVFEKACLEIDKKLGVLA